MAIYRTEKDYNEDELKGYLNNFDYDGAVSYLKSFTLSDRNKQEDLNRKIRSLQRQGSIIDGMLSNASDDDRDAIKFTLAAQSGYINTDTNIGQKYSTILGRIGSDGKNKATSLRVEFDNNQMYTNFLQNMELAESDLRNKGVVINSKNGIKSITFDKSNPEVINLIKGLHDTKETNKLALGVVSAGMLATTKSPLLGEELISSGLGEIINGFNVIGVDAEGNDLDNDGTAFHKLNRLYRITNRANNVYKTASENNGSEVASQIVSTDFIGAAHSELLKALSNNEIDTNEYKRVYDNINNVYVRRLVNEGYASKAIFIADDADNFTEITDTENKAEIGRIIRERANNGDRFQFSACMAGSTMGTLVTITGKSTKGEQPEQGKNYNTDAEYRIFIPNLFNDEVEQSFDRNTKTRSIRTYNDLVTYGGKEFLSNDYIISNVDNNGGYISNPKLGISNQYKNNAELLDFINESYIKDDFIQHYGREYEEINNKNLYINGYSITENKNSDILEQEIIARCFDAAEEIVGNKNSKEYRTKVLDFYNTILDGIGYTEARHLTLE